VFFWLCACNNKTRNKYILPEDG